MVNGNVFAIAFAVVMLLVFLVFLTLFFSVVKYWVQALLTNTPASIIEIIGLRLRRLPVGLIVHAAITLAQRGIKAKLSEVVDCYTRNGAGRAMNATQLATLVVAERADGTNRAQI